jgi:hypothetical protein
MVCICIYIYIYIYRYVQGYLSIIYEYTYIYMMLDGFLDISKEKWMALETNRNPSLMASHGSLSPSLETVLQMCNGPPCHESLTLFSGPCRSTGTEEMFFDPRDGTWALKIGM